jgi:F0F1-type ATP synthase epsilon subunit
MPKRTLASTGEIVDVDPAKAAEEAARHIVDGKAVMDIKVYAPFKVYYEGVGVSLTAVNESGPFDILPHHHNFLCMLVPCDLLVRTPEGETKTIRISRALMHVKAEKVTVFVDV